MRCFIAIDVDDKFRNDCSEIQDKLKKLELKASYVKPENIHLTLKFFAELEESKALEIMKEFEKGISEIKAFNIEVRDISTFIKKDEKSIVWLSVNKNLKKIKYLVEVLERISVKYHDEKEGNLKFKAHFTLLRIKINANEEKKLLQKLETIDVNLRTKVKKLALYKSELTLSGSKYSEIYSIDLK